MLPLKIILVRLQSLLHYFSIKSLTQHIKEEGKTPLFSKSGKLSGISQNIYDLLLSGLQGFLKKDAVISVLKDIAVGIYNLIYLNFYINI